MVRRQRSVAAAAVLALIMAVGTAACSQNADQAERTAPQNADVEVSDGAEQMAGEEATGAEADEAVPTVVARLVPTATPTADPADDPLFPVASERLPGVPLPAGASLVRFDEAVERTEDTEGSDAVGTYVIEGVDSATLYDWFVEHMADEGWGEPEDRDGALIFLHTVEESARFEGEESSQRTATVYFDTLADLERGTTFTVIVEVPAGS